MELQDSVRDHKIGENGSIDNFSDKTNYINRELSWIEFNARVLEEAQDKSNPLIERMKFLSIVSSNFDEFFMVRVASLREQVNAGISKADISGMKPKEQLKKISLKVHGMMHDQYNCYSKAIVPALRKAGIKIADSGSLDQDQKEYLDKFFEDTLFPILTPMAVDKSRPFPLILNKSLNIAVLLENEGSEQKFIFATVQVPSILDRLAKLPGEDANYIFLEGIIKLYLDRLFKGQKIICSGMYRITRNADLSINEEDAEDLLKAIEKYVKKRKWASSIRLEVDYRIDDRILQVLKDELELKNEDIYYINGPLDLTFLMKFINKLDSRYDHLRNEVLIPLQSVDLIGAEDIFQAISERDLLLHHPYESFDCVVEFVKRASADPGVMAIKQTLYRVSGNSPIINALETAAENGKQVTVLLELKARFDEENNINWAKRLEKAGCHVIYGLAGLKIHCKMTLVVRKEEEGIKRYVHLATGNYNDITARIYTDLGMFTADPYIGADTSSIFNMLSGYSQLDQLRKLEVAPYGLRKKFLELIANETKNARAGKKSGIMAKVNSLVDQEIIDALYEASGAGVPIQLIVRGVCCLRPGVPGLSENIKVISIVDRFLEHSRIYYFNNNDVEQLYLSSADWMYRNLDRRVEVMFPVEDGRLKDRILDVLNIMLQDTEKARILGADGRYRRVDRRGKRLLQSQLYIYNMIRNEVVEKQRIKE